MTSKQIAIGADVRSNDGRSIGKVKHLVVDAQTNSVTAFVADKGIFDVGRVVSLDYVTDVTEDTVTLSMTDKAASDLPGFVEHEFFQFHDSSTMGGMSGGMVDLPGGGNTWFYYGSGSGGLPSTGASSFYERAVVGDVSAREVSPLEESDIVLDHGTDVVTSDGHKIGKVDEILYDDAMKVTAFIVRSGFLFHHDVTIPWEWVDGMTHDHVRLNVTKEIAGAATSEWPLNSGFTE